MYQQGRLDKRIEDTNTGFSTWQQALTLFDDHHAIRGRTLSKRTRAEYATDLSQLVQALEKRGVEHPQDIDLADLKHYLNSLIDQGYSALTIRRKVACIKSFFACLQACQVMTTHPATGLIPPQRDDGQRRYLTVQECRALLTACANHPRDAAIIELMLHTGIRVSEVVHLHVNDVKLPTRNPATKTTHGQLFIRGKGKRARMLTLDVATCQALRRWLLRRASVDYSALFLTRFDQPMVKRGFQYLVTKYLDQASIKKASVKSMRHTYAVNNILQGIDLKALQTRMGFAFVQDTYLYLGLAEDVMTKASEVVFIGNIVTP